MLADSEFGQVLRRLLRQLESYQKLHSDDLTSLSHALSSLKIQLSSQYPTIDLSEGSPSTKSVTDQLPEFYGSTQHWSQKTINREDHEKVQNQELRNQPSAKYRLGIDIGGTFTDFVVVDEVSGRIAFEKAPSTPSDLWKGIEDGLGKLDIGVENMGLIVHGTTVGLNTVLAKSGPPTGLITTAGFRDVYEIARHNRTETYDLFYRKPEPIIPRRYRLEVRERIDYSGMIIQPLVEQDVVECVSVFKDAGISAIAVCFLHSYINPEHEKRTGEILQSLYPEASVTLSHDVVRQWREYERTGTTVLNAHIMSVVGTYLDRVEDSLNQKGYARPFFINQSSGGIMSARAAKKKPIHTVFSGPAGGAMASVFFGQLSGHSNVIMFDMGGTSTDVALIHEGELRVTAETEISRHPVMVSTIDIKSIGAGGGSIAWIDPGGALNVGPKSAGADPGPACYGKGGSHPTVTDANLVLGRLHPDLFLGGEFALYPDLARQQIDFSIAKPLNLSVPNAAKGVIEIVNTKMAYAVRAITIERGLDPKVFALMAFGGAGPMHACAVSRQLGIPEIIIPVGPGAFSAMGMLVSDVRHDLVRTFLISTGDAEAFDLACCQLREMVQKAIQVLRAEGVDDHEMVFRGSVDMRYCGQEYTVAVPLSNVELSQEHLEDLRSRFHVLHDRNYGHSSPSEPTEIVNLRVAAIGRVVKPSLETIDVGGIRPVSEAIIGETHAYFSSTVGALYTPLYYRDELRARNTIEGPAIIIEKTATTVVEPGFHLEVMPQGHMIIRRRK